MLVVTVFHYSRLRRTSRQYLGFLHRIFPRIIFRTGKDSIPRIIFPHFG